MSLEVKWTSEGAEFCVRLKPRSSRCAVIGESEGVLVCAVNAPPVDGKANEALIELLSKHFDVPKKALELVAGLASKNKRVRVGNPFALRAFSHSEKR